MWVNPSDGPLYFRVETDDNNNIRVLTFDSTISRAGKLTQQYYFIGGVII